MSEGRDVQTERTLQNYRTAGREVLRWDQGQVDMMECGLRLAVEAKRKGRGTEREQSGEKEQRKKVHVKEEEQRMETREQWTDEQDVMSDLLRGEDRQLKCSLVRGEMRGVIRTRPSEKGKGKGNLRQWSAWKQKSTAAHEDDEG